MDYYVDPKHGVDQTEIINGHIHGNDEDTGEGEMKREIEGEIGKEREGKEGRREKKREREINNRLIHGNEEDSSEGR